MLIYHCDFAPHLHERELPFSTLSLNGMHGGAKYDTFRVLVDRVNKWLSSHPDVIPIHLEVLEVDGIYNIADPPNHHVKEGKDSLSFEPLTAFLKIIRVWYMKRDGTTSSKADVGASQIAYAHIIPARLESNPRAFNPKFESLEQMMETFNRKIDRNDLLINGPLLSVQTGMFRLNAKNCSLDPERTFWMINKTDADDLHCCFYLTLFFCPNQLHSSIHHIGFKDFAPALRWKGDRKNRLESESIGNVLARLSKWLDEEETKMINIQTIDHHAFYRCSKDETGYEEQCLVNPHFRSSFSGLMQFAKVIRLFHCSCACCCHDDHRYGNIDDKGGGGGGGAVSRSMVSKSFHVDRFIPVSQMDFSVSSNDLQMKLLHMEYLPTINDWISTSGATLLGVETLKVCLTDGRCRITADDFVFSSSLKQKSSAVYAIRVYVRQSRSSFPPLDLKPLPRYVQSHQNICCILM